MGDISTLLGFFRKEGGYLRDQGGRLIKCYSAFFVAVLGYKTRQLATLHRNQAKLVTAQLEPPKDDSAITEPPNSHKLLPNAVFGIFARAAAMSHNHGGGSMSGMGGMSMGGTGAENIQPVNMYMSKLFWWMIAGVVGFGLMAQIVQRCDNYLR